MTLESTTPGHPACRLLRSVAGTGFCLIPWDIQLLVNMARAAINVRHAASDTLSTDDGQAETVDDATPALEQVLLTPDTLQLVFRSVDDIFRVAAVCATWRTAVDAVVSSWPLQLSRSSLLKVRSFLRNPFMCRDVCSLPDGRLCIASSSSVMERRAGSMQVAYPWPGNPAHGHPVQVIGEPHRATVHDMLYWNARAELPADLAAGVLLGVTAMVVDSAGENIWCTDHSNTLQCFRVADGSPVVKISTGPDTGNGCEEDLPAPRGLSWLSGNLVVATEVGLAVVDPRRSLIFTTLCSAEMENEADEWCRPFFTFGEHHVGMASRGAELFVADEGVGRVQVRTLKRSTLTNAVTRTTIEQLRLVHVRDIGVGVLGGPQGIVIHRQRMFVADFGQDEGGKDGAIIVFSLVGDVLQRFVVVGIRDRLLSGICLLRGGTQLAVAVNDDSSQAKAARDPAGRDTIWILNIYAR